MTLNDLECPIQLKVHFTNSTFDIRMMLRSQLAMGDCMNVALTVGDKSEANEL